MKTDQHPPERGPITCKPASGGSHPRLVRHWADLAEVPESATHRLEINVQNGNGWIKKKGEDERLGIYLSTHTFYGSNYAYMTRRLQECGFNVQLANWDA